MIRSLLLALATFMALTALLRAQQLDKPESVAYSPVTNSLYISNPGSRSVSMQMVGLDVGMSLRGFHKPLGLLYADSVVWVADSASLRGLDQHSPPRPSTYFPVPGATQLNGITTGPSGCLLVSDRMGKTVLRVRPGAGSYDTLCTGIDMPNGMIMHDDSTLILVNSLDEASFFLIDPAKGHIRAEIPSGYANLDGITPFGDEGYLVSSWGIGWKDNRLLLLRQKEDGSWEIAELMSSSKGLADIHYFPDLGELIMPAYLANELIRVPDDEIRRLAARASFKPLGHE